MLGPLAFVLLLRASADGLDFQQALRPVASTPGPGPYYDDYFSGNVTALLGTEANLNCRVKQANDVTVSWLRVTDVPTLLSVGTYTYTMDNRIKVTHNSQSSDWILTLQRTTHNDSGVYDCQVGTTPPLTRHIHLTVVEPDTEIIGGPEIFIDQRSTINLTCVIEHAPQPPDFILWEHNSKMINYDSDRGGVSVVTTKGRTTVSQLLIRHARPPDSGRYACRPASSKPAVVSVHVLKGGQRPEAMHTGGSRHTGPAPPLLVLLLLLLPLAVIPALLEPPLTDLRRVRVR